MEVCVSTNLLDYEFRQTITFGGNCLALKPLAEWLGRLLSSAKQTAVAGVRLGGFRP
jgi:hypothetical protein